MNNDPINPKHYKHLPVEAIDIIEAAIAKAPSNESAYLQGQVLKYLLRCWSKKGIEDLRKAKWYLDRMVVSFDDLLAEASGASDERTAKPSRTQPPSGYRLLGPAKDEPRIEGDQYWSLRARAWCWIEQEIVEYANRDNWPACRKIEPPIDEPSEDSPPKGWRKLEIGEDIDANDKFWFCDNWMSYEKDNLPRGKLTGLHVTHIRKIKTPIAPPKRYRDPTEDDLANGPIDCEVRDCDIQAWRKATLQNIYPGAAYEFQVRKHGSLRESRYAQCRIEVTE